MDLKINSSACFAGRQQMLGRLHFSSAMTKVFETYRFKDQCLGIEDHALKDKIYGKPILEYIKMIAEDVDFTLPVIDSFTKEELKPIKDHLHKISNKQAEAYPHLRYLEFFEKYLTKRYLTGSTPDFESYKAKKEVINALISKVY